MLCAWGTGEARPSPTLCPVLRARGGGDARAPGLCGTLDAPLSECSDAQLPKRLLAWQGLGLGCKFLKGCAARWTRRSLSAATPSCQSACSRGRV